MTGRFLTSFSTLPARLTLSLGGAALAFLTFILITRELVEGDVDGFDKQLMLAVDSMRNPWLTSVATDITALGSLTIVVLFSALTLAVLFVLKDKIGALQLMAASVGSGILTLLTKDIIERIRPPEAQRLIAVSGFSYPSGHSLSTSALYLTIAIIAARHLRNQSARIIVFFGAAVMLTMVGASRVYLGVHYATDVLSGISLGAAWALMLAGCVTLLSHRKSS